jgi:hypothetical protein
MQTIFNARFTMAQNRFGEHSLSRVHPERGGSLPSFRTIVWGHAFLLLGVFHLAGMRLHAQATIITLQNPTATFSQTAFDVGFAIDIDSVSNGWAIEHLPDLQGTRLMFIMAQKFGGRHTIGRFRLSATNARSPSITTTNWTVLVPSNVTSAQGATLTVLGDNSVLASGNSPLSDTYRFTAKTSLNQITAVRIEVLEDPSLPPETPCSQLRESPVTGHNHGPGRRCENGNFVLSNLVVMALPNPRVTPQGTVNQNRVP